MRPFILKISFVLYCMITSSCLMPGRSAEQAPTLRMEMERLCAEYRLPGMTVAWVGPGGSRGSAAIGFADVERRVSMRPDTRMLAASIGKSFVGALCAALAAEEQVSLDAPVGRWLGERPWFAHVPNHQSISLRHLLTHSAGLPDHVHTTSFARALSTRWSSNRQPFAPEELVAFILDEPPLFPAGQGWAYSDTGYVVAGMAVEAATGWPLFAQIKERFLDPLELADTEPSNRRDLTGLAAGYTSADNPFGFPLKSIDADGRLRWHPGIEWAGGGLVTTAPDLAKWGSALLAETTLPGPGLEREVVLASVPMSESDESRRYGLGIGVTNSGTSGPVYGHAGWIPGYISSLRHYSAYGLTIAIQINTDDGIADAEEDVLGWIEKQILQTLVAEGTPFIRQGEHIEEGAHR